jgi:hypothetical protein
LLLTKKPFFQDFKNSLTNPFLKLFPIFTSGSTVNGELRQVLPPVGREDDWKEWTKLDSRPWVALGFYPPEICIEALYYTLKEPLDCVIEVAVISYDVSNLGTATEFKLGQFKVQGAIGKTGAFFVKATSWYPLTVNNQRKFPFAMKICFKKVDTNEPVNITVHANIVLGKNAPSNLDFPVGQCAVSMIPITVPYEHHEPTNHVRKSLPRTARSYFKKIYCEKDCAIKCSKHCKK